MIAEPDGIRPPTGPDLAQQKSLDALTAVNGQAFDRQFMDQVIRDHEAAVADFEKAAGVDGECGVKTFARSQLPTLRERLEMARRIRSALGAAPPR